MNKLFNECLELTIKPEGAEMTSIKFNNKEYLWNGESAYWNRHAPVLFPIVGMLKEGKCKIKDKEYSMSRHGFARDMIFEVFEKNNRSITYLTKSNDETKKKYPFDFELYIKYEVIGNKVINSYKVVNRGINEMLFSIGSHPAFNLYAEEAPCPSCGGYYIEFEEEESAKRLMIKNGLLQEEGQDFFRGRKKIDLSTEIFAEDALVFKNLKSNKIRLGNMKNDKKINIDFTGFPYLGIWSKEEGAPFVCIEPWYGVTDKESHNGNFEEKEGILKLLPNEEFMCKYFIEIEG